MLRFALKLAFGLAILGLIAWLVDISETMRTLHGLDLGWLLAAIVIYLAIRVLMGLKWWVLLGGRDAAVSYPTVQRAMLLSDYHGLLFPNTLAVDALRAALMRHHPRGLTFMTASIVADRVINLSVAAAIALVALAVTHLLTEASFVASRVSIAVVAIAGSVLLATMAVVSRKFFDGVIGLSRALAARSSIKAIVLRVSQKLDEVHCAMSTMLTDQRMMRRAVLLAVMVILVRGFWTYCLFVAVGVPVSLFWIVTLMPVITMIALLPLTVLGLGLKDGAFIFFFNGIGVAAHAALAVSLTSYAVIIACNLSLGLLATMIGPPLPKAVTSGKS
jgi:uncharacterized protein (TIRG00374 family)